MGLVPDVLALRRDGGTGDPRLPWRGRGVAASPRRGPDRSVEPPGPGLAVQGNRGRSARGLSRPRLLPAPTAGGWPRSMVRPFGTSSLAGEGSVPRSEPGLRRAGDPCEGVERRGAVAGAARDHVQDRSVVLQHLLLPVEDGLADRAVYLLPGSEPLRLACAELPGVCRPGGHGDRWSFSGSAAGTRVRWRLGSRT